ncbi:MAG: hypothetical protein RLZZ136_1305, partial [Pseudomonadota bacterium]
MLRAAHITLQDKQTLLHRCIVGGAWLGLGLFAAPALAQDAALAALPTPIVTPQSLAGDDAPIGFEADSVDYDYNSQRVTAHGKVVLRHDDQSVRADQVVWDRKSGAITASGNIRMVDADGNQVFTDKVELTDALKAGAMDNLLIALREGGRVAALSGKRLDNGNVVLTKAAYTGCAVEDASGCPKQPSWQVKAAKVTYDEARHNLRFKGAHMELFGLPIIPLPGLVLATDGRPINGLLIPSITISPSNGVELSDAWYQRLGPNQDLQIKGYVYSKSGPMLASQYRLLTGAGALQVTGYVTRSSRIATSGSTTDQTTNVRGYFASNARFQFNPAWSLSASVRYATDRTFLRRYDISHDDRLRSTFNLERIGTDSYFSLMGWATQTMRVSDSQGQVPFALPVMDYRRRFADPLLGGRFELQINSLALSRTAGQDTQHAFTSAQWNLAGLNRLGQEISFTALVRGDVYHSSDNALTQTASYQGLPGWQKRAIASAAIDAKWPFVGQLGKGVQVLTPRVQLIATPLVKNQTIPNEDSRAIDLEDTNLFALNRFPGSDRIEDGARVTYGFDWQWQAPGWRITSTVGQSYRVTSAQIVFPDGTGLHNRVSDIVGRTELRIRDAVKLTHRFRLDKDNLAVRRNEFDATVGSERTYVELGYLRLNRNITTVEDLQDREELRFSGRLGFARHWSVFGSGIVNLTGQNTDPLSTSNGFQPLRTRAGVAYQDECLELALTWRRDYVANGDARKG